MYLVCLRHGVMVNTTDFGSVILGSNPGAPTKYIKLACKLPDNLGSSPS